jgi:asparagine synthetase B (glutamine-hydrolysing)
MDMTIGPALWFAARGRGIVQVRCLDGEQAHTEQGNYEEAESLAKVLLLGHGADEQLAGYGRHRNAWRKRGEDGIKLELDKDTARLWIRNLGRDDRVISSLGKESRLPYLDCDLMEFLSALDTDMMCDFEEPAGVGDKRILRELARRLRLTQASAFPKRALQFGSRISRLTNSKNGGHVPFEGYR